MSNAHHPRLPFHRLAVLFLLALVGTGLAQASGPSVQAGSQPPKVLVGFAQDNLANDWRLAQVQGVQAGLAAHPEIEFVYTDAEGSTAKQIGDVEDLIIRGVNILITSPRDSRAMAPIVSRAYHSGIPVILLTRRIEGDAYTTFISPDDASIARDAARFLAGQLNGKGRVLMLQGVPSASTAVIRTSAFIDELANYPAMSVAAIVPANYLRSDAVKAVEEVLLQGIGFDAIYAQSDSMASGARIALKHAGHDLSTTLIVGIDYIAEAREAIRAGEQLASYTYPVCAAEAVDAVLAIIAGKPVQKSVQVKSQRVTRENVDQVAPIF